MDTCYYCTICREATHEKRCHRKYCQIYKNGIISANRDYIPRCNLSVRGCTARYYCRFCHGGKNDPQCDVHFLDNLQRHMGVYISQRVHFELNTDEKYNDSAIQACKNYIASGTIYKKQAPINANERIGICPVCLRFVAYGRHCSRVTKLYRNGELVPDPAVPPDEVVSGVSYHGDYYCSPCKHSLTRPICWKCGKAFTHQWINTETISGYIRKGILRDYNRPVALTDSQKKAIYRNASFLVVSGCMPKDVLSMIS